MRVLSIDARGLHGHSRVLLVYSSTVCLLALPFVILSCEVEGGIEPIHLFIVFMSREINLILILSLFCFSIFQRGSPVSQTSPKLTM